MPCPTDALDDEVDLDVIRPVATFDFSHVAHMEFAPQEGRVRKGDGEKVMVIDGDARAILRRTLP